MSNPITRALQRRALRRGVRRALEAGTGLYQASWPLERDGGDAAERLLAWCRDTIAATARPYGLDHVSLTLTLRDAKGRICADADLGVFRPIDFYNSGRAEAELRAVLSGWARSTPDGGRVAAVLLSWGDVTRELLEAG